MVARPIVVVGALCVAACGDGEQRGSAVDAASAGGAAGSGGSAGSGGGGTGGSSDSGLDAAVDAGEEVLWPISGSALPDADEIRAQYGPRWIGKYDFHAGIDIPAPKGTPARSILAGKVVNVVSWDGASSAGNNVLVEHSGARFSAYLHLDSIGVKLNDQLVAGDVVGTVGDTGATYDHLHLTYMVGLPSPKNDERKSKNPLEILPHTAPATPSVTFAGQVRIDVPVQQMTVRRVTLAGGAESRTVDYYDVVALGSVARDEHVQFGVYLGAEAAAGGTFPLILGLDPADFSVTRVVLEDFSGDVVLDAAQ